MPELKFQIRAAFKEGKTRQKIRLLMPRDGKLAFWSDLTWKVNPRVAGRKSFRIDTDSSR